MEAKRNIAQIARSGEVSPQNMQHFISQSPWSADQMIAKMQRAVAERPELAGGMLILDESADKKSGSKTVAAGRQYNGRRGKVDLCQVGTFLAYAHNGIWTWINGEIFVPERWFSPEYVARRIYSSIRTDCIFPQSYRVHYVFLRLKIRDFEPKHMDR